jgi:hypothetical protein
VRWTWTLAEFEQGGASSQRWWLAEREFHRARREICDLRGWAHVREADHTLRNSVRAIASRAISSMRP